MVVEREDETELNNTDIIAKKSFAALWVVSNCATASRQEEEILLINKSNWMSACICLYQKNFLIAELISLSFTM